MYFQTPQVENTFNTEVSSVNVVAKEKVSRLGRVTSNFEELHEIVVLAVNVAAYGDRRVHLKKVGLGSQELGPLLDNP